MLALVACAFVPASASAQDSRPRVTIAMLPAGTTIDEIAAFVPGIAPGIMSAGLGSVPANQTYLDIGQGNRVFGSLYPEDLPPLYVTGDRVPADVWDDVVNRAEGAPADVVPGLLATMLKEAGVVIAARPLAGSPALMAADEEGLVRRASGCAPGLCRGVTVLSAGLSDLARLASRLEGDDLLIAIERPPPDREQLSIGIAGTGFADEELRSLNTRTDGYVLTTDVLPTILARYGIEPPGGITGREIETTGRPADLNALLGREARLAEISERRSPVVAVNLLAWIGACLLAVALAGRRGAAIGLPVLAGSMAWVPALLLVGAALEPSVLAERLIVGLGAPLLSGLSLAAFMRLGPTNGSASRAAFATFALAAAGTTLATAIDIVAGSPLTTLSLLGPNPGRGVRFFGIGNELEAVLGALIPLGCGAAVFAAGRPDPGRSVALLTVAVTIVAVLVFAPGRLGADVGAAITLPAGAAGVVIAALGLRRKRALLVLATPILALAALIAVDLVLGGDAHLSRSVLDAGGLDQLGDVLERRIIPGARSFAAYIESPFFIVALVGIGLGIAFRRRISAWFTGREAARAGVAGALVATVVGTLANDSGALLLMVGTGFVAAFCGLAWASRAHA